MDAPYYKYPRTRHLPSSRSRTDDDKIATVAEVEQAFTFEDGSNQGRRVIITEKMDGECTTIYSGGHSHARSVDSKYHPSRTIVRELAAMIGSELPEGYRVCGENIFAVHSIEYVALPAYFQAFSIWDGETCLSWDDTVEWAEILDVATVPVLYDGEWFGEAHAKAVWEEFKETLPEGQESEGFVVRLADSFTYDDFGMSAFKFVRERHVQTGDHWMHSEMRANQLDK